MDVLNCSKAGGETRKDGDFIYFGRDRFKDGFLFKTVPMSGLEYDSVKVLASDVIVRCKF